MNKKELIEKVAEKVELTKKDVELVLGTLFDTIVETVESGEKIAIYGFGTFEAKERAGREGRNPKTKEPLHIEASKRLAFKQAGAVKKRLNNK